MQPTDTTTFKVRHYECDPYGHLNHANYVRYMEEAAFNASASVGYPKERYESMGYLWLARETEIEYLKPLFYGDEVQVKTWVGDFRRVRSIRRYEFRIAGSDELYAVASTDWVYINRETLRPAAVSPEMVAAFSGNASEAEIAGSTREPFPTPPAPPAGVFKLRRRVEWRDLDSAQHVNNAVYLNYAEDCGIQAAAHFGWPASRCQAINWGIFARKERVEYRLPAVMDDELEITTWAYDVKRISATRHYDIRRVSTGELLAQVESFIVSSDITTGRPMRIPDEFLKDAAANIAS